MAYGTQRFIVAFTRVLSQINPIPCNGTYFFKIHSVGLVGLGVTCSSRDPRFAGSNPVEVDGFFQDVKILMKSPPGETLSWGFRV